MLNNYCIQEHEDIKVSVGSCAQIFLGGYVHTILGEDYLTKSVKKNIEKFEDDNKIFDEL